MRPGAQTLALLGTSRIFLILQSLAEGRKGRLDLRRDAGSPAQSTMRGHLKVLEMTGAIHQYRQDSFPGALEYELTESGEELLGVAKSLEHWLADAPQGGLELGSDPARAAIKGLVAGWSANVLAALAEEPLSLTELDKRIAAFSYPTIERCLETMRLAGQVDAGSRNNRGTPYAVTSWVRHGLAPLVLGARWEYYASPADAPPICATDISDAFALVAPLMELPERLTGIGQLAVKVPGGDKQRRHLGFVEVRGGQIEFAAAHSERKPDAWLSGTMDAWFSTVTDTDTHGLKLDGDRDLAKTILGRLHEALFRREGQAPQLGEQAQG